MEEEKKTAKTEPKKADETKPEKDDAEKLELYRFVHSFSEVALKSEMTRKSQILDQSRTIQTVFSILSVALFSVAQLLADKGFQFSWQIILCAFIVFGILVASLVLACLAQYRRKIKVLPDPAGIKKQVQKYERNLSQDASKENWKADWLQGMYERVKKNNDFMVRCINASTLLMLGAVVLLFAMAVVIAVHTKIA